MAPPTPLSCPRGAPVALATPRLDLLAPEPARSGEMVTALAETHEALHRWMEWAVRVPTVGEQQARMVESRARFLAAEEHNWMLIERASGRLLGMCGLPRPRWDEATLEIGYWIRTSAQGRGYVTEAVTAVTEMCFDALGARRVEVRMSDANRASWRVAERAGFIHERTLRGDGTHPDGSPRDTRVYARER